MTNQYARVQILTYLFLFTFFSSTASADVVLDSGGISVQEPAGGGFTGGISTFSLTAAELQTSNFSQIYLSLTPE